MGLENIPFNLTNHLDIKEIVIKAKNLNKKQIILIHKLKSITQTTNPSQEDEVHR